MTRFGKPILSVAEVIATVTFETGGVVDASIGQRRTAWLTWQRAAIAWCAHVTAKQRLPTIAIALGQDRRTILAAVKRGWMLRLTDADFRRLTDLVAGLLTSSAADQQSEWESANEWFLQLPARRA